MTTTQDTNVTSPSILDDLYLYSPFGGYYEFKLRAGAQAHADYSAGGIMYEFEKMAKEASELAIAIRCRVGSGSDNDRRRERYLDFAAVCRRAQHPVMVAALMADGSLRVNG